MFCFLFCSRPLKIRITSIWHDIFVINSKIRIADYYVCFVLCFSKSLVWRLHGRFLFPQIYLVKLPCSARLSASALYALEYFSFPLGSYLCRRLKTRFRLRMSFLLRASKYPSYPIGWLFSQLAKRTTSLQTCPLPFCAWKISTDSLLLFCSKSGHLECLKFTAAARCVQSLFQNSNETQTCLGVSAVAGLYIRKMIPLVHRCHRIPCLRILWGSSALSLYIYRAENCSSITKTAISLDKNIRSSA